jgi:hypothetical protein
VKAVLALLKYRFVGLHDAVDHGQAQVASASILALLVEPLFKLFYGCHQVMGTLGHLGQ